MEASSKLPALLNGEVSAFINGKRNIAENGNVKELLGLSKFSIDRAVAFYLLNFYGSIN